MCLRHRMRWLRIKCRVWGKRCVGLENPHRVRRIGMRGRNVVQAGRRSARLDRDIVGIEIGHHEGVTCRDVADPFEVAST